MIKLLLLLLLVSGISNAQVVNIPDGNFKARLQMLGVDSNNNGNIEVAEALVTENLDLSYSYISDLTGIEAFQNLSWLNCDDNQLIALPLQSLAHMQYLSFRNNQIASFNLNNSYETLEYLDAEGNLLTYLDLTVFSNLKEVRCGYNQLTSFFVYGLYQLEYLNCYYNVLTSLDVTSNTALATLYCDNNQLTSLNVAPLTNLKDLSFAANQISSINLSTLANLEHLRTAENPIASLDVTPLVNLYDFKCYNNQLTSLDLSTVTNLRLLQCGSNPYTSLDLTPLTVLQTLECNFTPLTTIDVSTLTELTRLKVNNNNLATLDVSALTRLTELNCSNNQLTSLYVKNGKNETINLANNPNLLYVCADETQVAQLQTQAGTGTLVSSYCSFVPGGIYNAVTGTARFDQANDGCGASDSIVPEGLKLSMTNGTIASATFTTNTGNYTLYGADGNYTVSAQVENPNYFNVSPQSTAVNFPLQNGEIQIRDFCLTANGNFPDAEIIIAPTTGARPGFDTAYRIVYRNKGNQTLSGAVTFTFDDSILDFISSAIAPESVTGGTCYWSFSNLSPFENRSIDVVLNLNSPTEVPAVNIGDILSFNATVAPTLSDIAIADNTFGLYQTVIGSFDPNDKICLEGAMVSPTLIGDYLHYVINFENTGTASAENVVVKDVIDASKFDVVSLQFMNSSHAAVTRIADNKVEFIFQNIQLQPNDHGHVIFKIKTKNSLAVHDAVTNKADIFFDYNFPVITDAATTAFSVLGTESFSADDTVSIYPNPSHDLVNIRASGIIQSVQLFDMGGRILLTNMEKANETKISLSAYASGIYYLKIKTDKGIETEKLLKK